MCFSDSRFPYGPFVPHYVARQYIENYFAIHKTDALLELNTTLEDLSSVPVSTSSGSRWKLTFRKYDAARHVDVWWEEFFDAVILANGHYSVPYVCGNFMSRFFSFVSPKCLTKLLGATSRWARKVYGEISFSSIAFKILPLSSSI